MSWGQIFNGSTFDYTKARVGTAISAKCVIVKCPECGRAGERQKSSHRTYSYRVVHKAEFAGSWSGRNRLKIIDRCYTNHPGEASDAA